MDKFLENQPHRLVWRKITDVAEVMGGRNPPPRRRSHLPLAYYHIIYVLKIIKMNQRKRWSDFFRKWVFKISFGIFSLYLPKLTSNFVFFQFNKMTTDFFYEVSIGLKQIFPFLRAKNIYYVKFTPRHFLRKLKTPYSQFNNTCKYPNCFRFGKIKSVNC